MRIVTLLPSATEIICALGRAGDVVGITHECDFPPEIRRRPVVVHSRIDSTSQNSAQINAAVEGALTRGESLYTIDVEGLRALRPDLLITQDLCDVCALPESDIGPIIEALPIPPQVLRLHPHTLADILNDILTVGAAVGAETEARHFVARLEARIARVEAATRGRCRPRVCCLEWLDPPFCGGHWMPELVTLAGGREMIGRHGRPSLRIDWAEIAAASPEVIVLALCGFDVARTRAEAAVPAARPEWPKLPAVGTGRVYATDASSFFSRSGPRIVDGLEILGALLHPGAATWSTPPEAWAPLNLEDIRGPRRRRSDAPDLAIHAPPSAGDRGGEGSG
ncbi:MAG TPA: cobalamin-binding protein [bacterium]|nr:cobalamin-binding protein [bacterium]